MGDSASSDSTGGDSRLTSSKGVFCGAGADVEEDADDSSFDSSWAEGAEGGVASSLISSVAAGFPSPASSSSFFSVCSLNH